MTVSYDALKVEHLAPGAVSTTACDTRQRGWPIVRKTGGTVVGFSEYVGPPMAGEDYAGRVVVRWPDGSEDHCCVTLLEPVARSLSP